MQTWVWLLSYWSLLLDNCSHVTRERSTEAFINFNAVWSAAIGIIVSSVCTSIRLYVTLCILPSAGLMPTEARGNYMPEAPLNNKCSGLSDHTYKAIKHSNSDFVWICLSCGLPSFTSSFFDSPSLHSDNSFELLHPVECKKIIQPLRFCRVLCTEPPSVIIRRSVSQAWYTCAAAALFLCGSWASCLVLRTTGLCKVAYTVTLH